MRESNIQSIFTAYLKKNGHPKEIVYPSEDVIVVAYELKISKTNKLYFSKFEEQQLPSLYNTKHKGVPWKFSDASIGMKMYDGIYIKGPAYVGICFYKPRKKKILYLIDIDRVLDIKSKSKFISEDELQESSKDIIKLEL